ncbi:TPA: hypothetical protein ACGCEE_004699, partial [Stenotrophomonas maltophilia]
MEVFEDHRTALMGKEGLRVHVQRTTLVAAVQAPGDGAAVGGREPAPGESQRLLGLAAGDVSAHACVAFFALRRPSPHSTTCLRLIVLLSM